MQDSLFPYCVIIIASIGSICVIVCGVQVQVKDYEDLEEAVLIERTHAKH